VGTIVGIEVEINAVLVGTTFVATLFGVRVGFSATRAVTQDERTSNRKRFSIRLIAIHYGVSQLAGVVRK
jgi:hypothetical protein